MNGVERETIRNWSGNVEFSAQVYRPANEAQVLVILNAHRDGRNRLRVIGSKHSMNDIAKSEAVIDMSAFNKISPLQRGAVTVTAEAGVTLEALQTELASFGLTLPARGTIKLQTIAGALSTGTHGSGRPSLSSFVTAVRIAAYESGVAKISDISAGDDLLAARTALGAMGVILRVTLQVFPGYFIEQGFESADDISGVLVPDEKKTGELAYPMQVFIRFPYKWSYFISRRRVSERGPQGEEEERKRLKRRSQNEQLNDRILPWVIKNLVAPRSSWCIKLFYRWLLPLALRFGNKDSVIDDDDHVQTMRHEWFRNQDLELFVPEGQFREADGWLKEMICAFANLNYVLPPEITKALERENLHAAFTLRARYTLHAPIYYQHVLTDHTLISMTAGDRQGRGEAYYSILLLSYLPTKDDGFRQFAEFISKGLVHLYKARPHWGKVFPLNVQDLAPLYPNLDQFKQLCQTYDPKGVFRNEFTKRVLGL